MKKGINIFQRLMNVLFVVWVLWFLGTPILALFVGDLDVFYSMSNVNDFPIIYFFTYFGGLLIFVVNYIFMNKATFWHRDK